MILRFIGTEKCSRIYRTKLKTDKVNDMQSMAKHIIKAIIIKVFHASLAWKQTDKNGRVQSPEIDPNGSKNLTYDQGGILNLQLAGKGNSEFINKYYWFNCYKIGGNVWFFYSHDVKTKLLWFIKTKCKKNKTINILEENVGFYFYNFWVREVPRESC